MKTEIQNRIDLAETLIENFSRRTGILSEDGDPQHRYLWTDALAVECLLSLYLINNKKEYLDRALRLIDLTHFHLGRFHKEDSREGWISGLSDNRAKQHPTASGLRIGKKLPERQAHEDFDEIEEWERDGQYFHYNTQWINSLIRTYQITNDLKYARWAAQLLEASSRFLSNRDREIRLYWKMSTDLTYPLVHSQGFQDALDGLICTRLILDIFPDKRSELNFLLSEFTSLCFGKNWKSDDCLSAGGLLLNALKMASLGKRISFDGTGAKELLGQAFANLDSIHRSFWPQSAEKRLAFRECGLSMAINLLKACSEIPEVNDFPRSHLQSFFQLALEIEEFWMNKTNRMSASWQDHENINSVTLAASLLAAEAPDAFIEMKGNKKTEAG